MNPIKRILCLILIVILTVASALYVSAEVGPFPRILEDLQERIVTDDGLFGYDENGELLCALPGVYCACEGHQDGSQPFVPGDIVHDDSIDSADALQVLRASVADWKWWENPAMRSGKICRNKAVLDVNNDEKVNAEDALDILKYSVGKLDKFNRESSWGIPVTPTDMP